MDLLNDDATGLLEGLKTGAFSAVELMEATYDQIEKVNPTVNALVSLLPREEAVALARQPVEGPLAGLPLAVKDLANAAGFPTSMGSPAFAGSGPAATDDISIARLRAAGAIVIGKTNTPEFGLGSHTKNPVHGITRNPYDLTRSTGGSSGGASAALATGMLPIADGSDMMGSLRNPAGWTNTYGLRPSFGLVPAEPLGDTFLNQISTAGPLARSPRDLERLLCVLAGPDPRQPHGRRIKEGVAAPKRLAWLGDWGGAWPMEEGILETCEQALSVFEDLEIEVVSLPPPFERERLWDAWTTLRSWQVGASFAPLMADAAKAKLLKPEAIWEAERGFALSGMEVHRASATRSAWFQRGAELFEEYDALLLPTAQIWPFEAELDWPKEIAGVAMDTYHRWMEVTVPASLAGLPALAMPAGFSEGGLPIGLQMIGPRGADLGLIALGARWHAAAPWTARRPGVAR
ncbi:MAG: amidase [Pseudomonadota bacterium]